MRVFVGEHRSLVPLLYASTLFVTLCNAMMALTIPWMVLQATGSILWTGTIASFSLAAVLAGSIASRKLIEWFGGGKIIKLAYWGNIVGILGALYCFSQDTLNTSLLIFFAIIAQLLDAAANIAIDARFPEIARFNGIPLSRLNAMKESLVGGGTILGAALAGTMLTITDPLYVLATSCLMGVLALLAFMPVSSLYRYNGPVIDKISQWEAIQWIRTQPRLRGFILLLLVVLSNVACLDDVLLPAYIDQTSKDPSNIGWIFGAYSIAAILSAITYANHHDKVADKIVLKTGVFGTAFFFSSLALFDTPIAIITSAFITGLLTGAMAPLIDTRFMNETPKHIRLAMLASLSTVSLAAAPVLVMVHAAMIEVFSIKILCSLIAALIMLLFFARNWE